MEKQNMETTTMGTRATARFTTNHGVTPKQIAAILKHVAAIASSEDVRGVIAGVMVETTADMVTFTATDSYRLLSVGVPVLSGTTVEPGAAYVVAAKNLKNVGQLIKSAGSLTIERADYAPVRFVNDAGDTFTAPVIPGTFPDWRRLVPESGAWPATGETVVYNPVRLAGLLDSVAGVIAGGRTVRADDEQRVRIGSMSPTKSLLVRATVTDYCDITGLLMPYRN
jgi:hypothetical protein